EVVGADARELGPAGPAVLGVASLDQEPAAEAAAEGDAGPGRRGLEAGDGAEAGEDPAVEDYLRAVLGVAAAPGGVRVGEPEAGHRQSLRLEARVHSLQPPERSHEKARADEQDERKRELRDDQGGTQPLAPGTARAPRALLERLDEDASRRLESGEEAE